MLWLGSLTGALLVTLIGVLNYLDSGGSLFVDPRWLLIQLVGLTLLFAIISRAIRALSGDGSGSDVDRDDARTN